MKTLVSALSGWDKTLLIGLVLLGFVPIAVAASQINFVLLLFVPAAIPLGPGMRVSLRT